MALVPAGGKVPRGREEVWNNIAQKIDAILTCTLCQLPYTEPKTLPCGHSFCRVCLGDYILQQRIKFNATNYFACPMCTASCPVPPKLAALPGPVVLKNIVDTVNTSSTCSQQCTICGLDGKVIAAAYYCTRCEDFLCDGCSRVHKKTRMTLDHLLVRLANTEHAHKSSKGPSKVRAYFGRHGEDLNNPSSICTNKADDVIVSNDNNDVAVFSVGGMCKKHLNQQPFYGDTTRYPYHPNRCLAFTREGYLAVAIRKKSIGENNTCVAVIQSLAGREIGTCVTKVCEFSQCLPSGIAIMINGQIVVSDAGLHCIYIFDNKYKFIRKFGKYGSANGKFNSPYYITVNDYDEILVSDYGNHCIKIFDNKGNFKRKIGMMGTGKGQLLHPMGICTDLDMTIIVADRDNHRVHAFDASGNYRVILVKNTFEKGRDIRPVDVAVNNSGGLLVLLKGIEGEDFSEIRSYEYDLSERQNRRNKRSSSLSSRYGSASRYRDSSPSSHSSHSAMEEQEFPNFEGRLRRGRSSKGDRSLLPPSGRAQKAYLRPLNFEANIESRQPAYAPPRGEYNDHDYAYDSDGYDYHPCRQFPNNKPASKICSIM